jgi:hypothetical protein
MLLYVFRLRVSITILFRYLHLITILRTFTYQVIEKFSEFVFLVRRDGVDVLQEQLVSVANLLQGDVDHRLGNQRGLRVLKIKSK